ncbi:HTH_Tnp_Tc3_2 domain-containing protein [Trichonephila clavipes]|nr:HTH_Tnp_Tc3_2 domain-containing protein [Trichonephila clavipes]
MQDCAPCHTARSIKAVLTEQNIPLLEWPGNSTHMSTIEKFWELMKREVAKDVITNKTQLLERIIHVWNHHHQMQETVQSCIDSQKKQAATAGEIARHTTQATGRPISRFTVARRLHGGGLFSRRPVRCVPSKPAHRRRRSLWCWEHRNWRDNESGRVLFTDDSRFSLSSDSHCILIWRERGSRNHPSNIIERDRYGGRGVLVWGGIMLGSQSYIPSHLRRRFSQRDPLL